MFHLLLFWIILVCTLIHVQHILIHMPIFFFVVIMRAIYLFLWNHFVIHRQHTEVLAKSSCRQFLPKCISLKLKTKCYSYQNWFFPLIFSRKVCLSKGGSSVPKGRQVIALTGRNPYHRRTYASQTSKSYYRHQNCACTVLTLWCPCIW